MARIWLFMRSCYERQPREQWEGKGKMREECERGVGAVREGLTLVKLWHSSQSSCSKALAIDDRIVALPLLLTPPFCDVSLKNSPIDQSPKSSPVLYP